MEDPAKELAVVILAMTNARSVIGSMDLDDVLAKRDDINDRLPDARRDMYLDEKGEVIPGLSRDGALAGLLAPIMAEGAASS